MFLIPVSLLSEASEDEDKVEAGEGWEYFLEVRYF